MLAALQELYLRGAGPNGGRNLGGPRTVVAVTGGGGSLVGAMLSQPGASSCLLEAVVPYSKAACLAWLDRTGRSANGEPQTPLLRIVGSAAPGRWQRRRVSRGAPGAQQPAVSHRGVPGAGLEAAVLGVPTGMQLQAHGTLTHA